MSEQKTENDALRRAAVRIANMHLLDAEFCLVYEDEECEEMSEDEQRQVHNLITSARVVLTTPPIDPCCDEGMTCLECDPDATFAEIYTDPTTSPAHIHVPYYVDLAGVTICEDCGQVISPAPVERWDGPDDDYCPACDGPHVISPARECRPCADTHPTSGCGDVGCTHNCQGWIDRSYPPVPSTPEEA